MRLVAYTSCVLAAVVVNLSVQPHRCFAQEAQKTTHAFTVDMRVEPETVMAGEPLQVHISFTTTNPKPVSLLVGDAMRWGNFEILQGGKVVSQWHQNTRSVIRMGRQTTDTLVLPSTKETLATLPTQVTALPVGDYVLRLHTKISNIPGWYVERMEAATSTDAQEDTVDVPFTVKPLDAEQMKTRISKLYLAIGKERDIKAVRAMCYELAMLPPDYATGAWRSLLMDSKTSGEKRFNIAEALSIQGTVPMADALLFVQYTDPIRDDKGNMMSLKSMIFSMAGFGGKKLYDYVLEEFKRHKGSPFDTEYMVDGIN